VPQEEEIIKLTETGRPPSTKFAKVLTRAGLDTAVLNDIASVIPLGQSVVLAWLKNDSKV